MSDLERFFSYKDYSDETQRYYKIILSNFVKDVGELKEGKVSKWLEKKYDNPDSRNTALQALKSFARELEQRVPPSDPDEEEKKFQLNLVANMSTKSTVTKLERKELRDEEMEQIFDKARGVLFSGLWCLAKLGCRPGELVALEKTDINSKPDKLLPPDLADSLGEGEYALKIQTEKTKVERCLFIDDFTKNELEELIEVGYGYQFLQKGCHKFRDIYEDLTPKVFRSTFQTKFQRKLMQVAQEIDLPIVNIELLVKVMSGHTVGTNIQSVYTEFGQDIKKAMLDHHFLER